MFRTEGPIPIWNIPGMNIRSDNTVFLEQGDFDDYVTDPDKSRLAPAGSSGTNFILTEDITLNAVWTPIGNATNPFRGKLYGNGHTITADTGFSFAPVDCTGIFGQVDGSGSEIRELCVTYTSAVSANASADTGGIAGRATAAARFTNCIVMSVDTAALSVTNSPAANITLGGMVGRMDMNVYISTGYSSLNVEINHNGSGNAYAGGIAGCIIDGAVPPGTPSSDRYLLNNITAVGNVSCGTNVPAGNLYTGGITGRYNSSTNIVITNLVYGGTLSFGRTTTVRGTGSVYGGGIIGYYQTTAGSSITGSSSTGCEIYVNDNSLNAYIGGVAGYLTGGGNISSCSSGRWFSIESRGNNYFGVIAGYATASSASPVYFRNCFTEDGDFSFTAGDGSAASYVGGFVGYANNGNFANCRARPSGGGAVVCAVSGSLDLGGFGGHMRDSYVTGCSANIIYMNAYLGLTEGQVCAGGLIGTMESIALGSSGTRLENSWFDGVYSLGAGNQYTGGLVGYSKGSSSSKNSISRCSTAGGSGDIAAENRAAGSINMYTGALVGNSEYTDISESFAFAYDSVSAISTTTGNSYTGGLAGRVYYGTIKNSYAIADVLADNKTASLLVAAGGIAGYLTNSDVQFCYVKGSVTAKSNGGNVYSGGVAGYLTGGQVRNSATLGTNVISRGGSGHASRIYAYPASGGGGGNYAFSSMCVAVDPSYPGTDEGSALVSANNASPHGADATVNNFRDANFWLNTDGLGFNMDGEGTGFDNTKNIWDTSIISARAYPRLLNCPEQ